MAGWIFAVITSLIYLLQTTVLCKLTVFGIMPDTVLVCILCYTMIYGREKGFVAAFVTGLCMDFLSGPGFGRHIIVYLLSSAFAGFLSENAFGKNFITAAIINFAVSLVGGAAMSLFLYVTKTDRNIVFSLFAAAPVYALYNMVAGLFIYVFMENIKKFSFRWE